MITPSFGLTATERVLPGLALDFTTASLDSRITFTRSLNTATRVNSSGYVENVLANTPRFDFDPITLACKGLLIEELRANRIWYSADFSDAAWTKANADFGLTSAAATAPDNTVSAFKMREATTTSTERLFFQLNKFVPFSSVVTVSVFLKANENKYAQIRLANGNGTFGVVFATVDMTDAIISGTGSAGTGATYINSTVTRYKDGWVRFSVTGSLNSDVNNAGIAVFMSNGTATSYAGVVNNGFFIWGAQVELGAFPTSYIPSLGAETTRNADVASITGTNFSSWYNASAGTFFINTSARNADALLTAGSYVLSANATALKKYATTYSADPSATQLAFGKGTIQKVNYYKQALLAAELASLVV